jgi:hypothetical protein
VNIIASLKDLQKVFLILVFLLVFFITLSPPQDADMWWHLSAGREMLEQGKILATDIFSYTKYGESWTNAFWLSDLILYLSYKTGGYPGIALFVSLIAVITMAVIYLHTAQNPFPLPLLIILLATFAIAPVWTPRPQILSFLLLAILDYGLSDQSGSIKKHPWILVPLFILWANMHGGFIFGFLLILACISGTLADRFLNRPTNSTTRQLGALITWTVIAALAISINPNGPALWKLPFYTVGVSIESIIEWRSPDFHRLDLHPVLWLIFLLIVGTGTSGKKLSGSELLKVIGFSYMAFVSQRSIGAFVVIATPVVINSLHDFWLQGVASFSSRFGRVFQRRQSKPIPISLAVSLNFLILAIFIVVIFLRAFSVSTLSQVHNGLPHQAVEWIRTNQPQGRMFNSYNWGGYLQWELPEYPVFIDGRADLYGEKLINGWWNVVNATDNGVALLDSWQVNFVLLEPNLPILQHLIQNGWHILYEDDIAVIIGRR